MVNITGKEHELSPNGVIDIEPYYKSIPAADFASHQRFNVVAERIYRTSDNRFDHVLMMTRTKNVYMVIVIDLVNDRILGHRLLDLNQEYGWTPPSC